MFSKKKMKKLYKDPNQFFIDFFVRRKINKTLLLEKKNLHRSENPRRKKATLTKYLTDLKNEIVREKPPILDVNSILYESFHGKSMSCNPYAIFKNLLKDPRFIKYSHIWVLEDLSSAKAKKYSKLPNVTIVKKNSKSHYHYLQKAKYLINNNTFMPFFSKQAGQVYINTQHGTPIKTMGKDIKGSFGLGANVTRNFLHADYLVMPNAYTTCIMLRSHDVDNLYPGKIIEYGYPRTDLSHSDFASKQRLKKALGIDNNKKVILYAPTYRGDFRKVIDQNDIKSEMLKYLKNRFSEKYDIIYKSHHLDKINDIDLIQDVDDYDTNELLGITDVLISDYSSLVFDFFSQRKPIIYFAYDEETYKKERGLYLSLHDLPGVVSKSIPDVINEIENIDSFMGKQLHKYNSAIKEYCPNEDGNITKKIIDRVFFEEGEAQAFSIPTSQKKRILIYGGGFLNNGVTTSVTGLLKEIDYEIFEVYLAFNKENTQENINRMRTRINDQVKILFYMKSGKKSSSDIHLHSKNEAKRLFGASFFDIAIDASGYGKLWPGIISYVNSKRRIIFLHNCMKSEQRIRPDIADYDFIFSLYESHFDYLVNVSSSSFEANSEFLPHLKNKMSYIDNFIDSKRIISLSQKEFVDKSMINFINIGRYTEQKGQGKLIEAFAKICQVNKNCNLYLVGYGQREHILKEQIKELKLTDKVFLTGKLENPYRILSECDCFILPSNYEGQGIVLLEALTLGIPCISTDIPGPRSILDKQYLYENSVEGLTKGMEDFLAGKIKLQRIDIDEYNSLSLSKLNSILASEIR